MSPEYGIYTYLYIGDIPFCFVDGGFWCMDDCFTKNLGVVLYSHSKGSGKHRNGTHPGGGIRTLKILQSLFAWGVYTPAGKSFMRFTCITML